MFKNIRDRITNFFSLIFGNLSWNTPPWINYLSTRTRAHPGASLGMVLAIALVLTSGFYLYHWYTNLPHPKLILAKITTPKLTTVDKVLVPDILSVDFGIISGGELSSRPVAPLNDIGKEVKQGVILSPKMPGRWVWQSDSKLEFTPDEDWPAGQTYDLQFDKTFFTPNARLSGLNYSFSTLPFEAAIASFKFYQDPVNPQVREAVATIKFSHPVDTASLENKIALNWQAKKNADLGSQTFKYTLTYDENKRIAYLHSEQLPLPSTERWLELTLAKGIKPISGPSATEDVLKSEVLIPDTASYFKVSNSSSSIIRNQQDQPEQVINLETTLGVKASELDKSVHFYLLPKDYPATAAEEAKPDYEWTNPGEVTKDILALAKPLATQAIPADRDYATLHSYKYNTQTPAYIYLKVDKGVHSFGNFTLANDYAAILKVPEYPKEISFLHKGSLLALGSEEKLSVLVRGLGAVKFDVARVLPNAVNHLVSQTAGDFNNPYFIDANFNQNNISEIFTQIEQFNASDPSKAQYTALNFAKYIATTNNSGGPLGLFLLQAHGWDAEKEVTLDTQANRLILITDIGLLVKDNVDGTHDVFAQSISQGTPINHATVEILGKNGLPLFTRLTDVQGHALFPSLKDFENDREPTVYIVRNGNDVSFIPYSRSDRQLNYSRFDIGGITSNNDNEAALRAFIFSDRGIYRPGDTAHIGMIVKQPYAMPQPAGLPLEVTVIDPRGTTVKDEKLTLDATGYLSLDFATTDTSATGQYLIYLYIVKDNHPGSLIGSTSIQVAEFLPDRLRISSHLSQETTKGWVSPNGLSVKIGLWNLYGAPAVNHRVGAKILLTPQTVTFKEFPDYTFIDPLLNPKAPPKTFSDNLTDSNTDAKGQAEFDLKLNRFEKATYQLTVFSEGFEAEGGRSVTTQTSSLVSPLAYFIGYKPDGDLNYIKQNSERKVQLIAIDPQLKQRQLNDLTLQVFSLHPVSTLVKKEDGTYQYQSIIQSTEVSSNPFSISAQGVDYNLNTQTIGDFLVTVVDKSNTQLSRFKYSVTGASHLPIPKNAELNVKLNKTEFNAGDDIEMQITAPYTGAGLITIERDKVHTQQWFKTDTTASIQKIKIPNDFQGDGYVNVAFVRDLNSPEIYMSPLSYSVMPFSVSHKAHEIKVDLTTPTLSKPGEPFKITYQTDKPSKIIVFAVDEGILQVTKYQTPDPLKFFFEKHALEVNTAQIVDQILPKYIYDREISSVGGDGGEAALRKNLNPFKRKTEAPIVYWSGILDADSTPRDLTYDVPDYFNGTLRTMAVAVASDAVGSASTTAEVRGDFVINPNVPTFVAPGDEFEVTASIANNVQGSGEQADIAIDLQVSDQLEIIGDAKQSVKIAEGKENTVQYKLRAKSKLGGASLTIVARMNDKSNKMTSTLSVRPAVAFSSAITSGFTKDKTKTLTLDRDLYPEYRMVEALASPNPLILVAGLSNYLNDYPYGCVEQLTSKALPWLVMAKQPWFTDESKQLRDKVQQTIDMLAARQMSNGAFNYWPHSAMTKNEDFASVYAMHFLTEAKPQGYNIPRDVFAAGIGFLKELANKDTATIDEARIQAYAIYILTRNEIVTTNYLTHLQLALEKNSNKVWRKDITSAYIAATYQLLKSSTEAEKIIAYYQPFTKQDIDATDFYNQQIADAQYLYLLALHFPEQMQKIDERLIMALTANLNSEAMSTVFAGYTSLALSSYGEHNSASANAVISISETMADGKQTGLSSSTGLYQKAKVSLGAKSILFNNSDAQGYFYQLTQSGFDKVLPKNVINQGIEVARDYRDSNNNVITTAKLGDEIYVHIRARAIDDKYHTNIAIADLLPGGFEVVRQSMKPEQFEYVDMREDRVIFFGGLDKDSNEIVYRIKATNTGKFIIPPMFAMAMYDPLVKAMGLAGEITVTK